MRVLADYLATQLERRHLTPFVVAQRAGVSVATVQALAAGRRGWNPSPRVLDGLARGLGADRLEVYAHAGRLPSGIDPARAARALRKVSRT